VTVMRGDDRSYLNVCPAGDETIELHRIEKKLPEAAVSAPD